jgi:hypothetical protein
LRQDLRYARRVRASARTRSAPGCDRKTRWRQARLIARYSKDTQSAKAASARAPTTAKNAAAPSLSDRVLALATGKTQHEITAACKGARPNHVGAALSRHKRAGRIEERDGKLYATHGTGAEQRATV